MSRKRRRKPNSHDVPHGDEKWLVSYSDLMTLLFGLFVLLYSFALKNKGVSDNIDKELKKISEKGFKAASIQESVEKMESRDLKKIIHELSVQLTTLQEQVSSSNQEIQKRELASESLSQQLKKTIAITKEEKSKTKNQEKNISESKSVNQENHTVLVYVRWDNRNHDIDMQVTTPEGAILDYRNRKITDLDVDEFLFDTKSGPGVEMFKTTQPKDGEYTFTVSIYNNKGDRAPSEVMLWVVGDGKEKLIEKLVLTDDDEGRSQIRKINLKMLNL